jgi:branched-chain amino acid transport system substrate-binding protein
MRPDLRKLVLLALVALVAALVAGCGGGSSSTGSESSGEATVTETETEAETESEGESESEGASALGTPNKATGKPIVFGMLNLENGPVTFPEVREAAEAAADYVNEYKGGIQGRPIEIATCATDGQPATSTRCANQVVEKDPLLILGGADTGAPGAIPVYERTGLAYIGGVPFTPVEGNSKDAAVFISLSIGDNAAATAYANKQLGAESGTVIQTSDTQGKFSGAVIKSTMEGLGMDAHVVSVSPSAADLSSAAAEAISTSPDMIYVEDPAACAAVLKALESVGNTATLLGIDPCTAPEALEAAGPAAEELYFAQPFESLDSGSEQAGITAAAIEKYAPKTALDSPALAGFGSVMNIAEKLNEKPKSVLQPSKILALFKEGSENPNWLAHPYTCDGKQVPGQAASCNGFMKIKQVQGEKIATVTKGWETGTQYYTPTE